MSSSEPVVRGRVVFRNRMGKTAIIKVRTEDKRIEALCFHKGSMTEDDWLNLKDVPLGATLTAEVGEYRNMGRTANDLVRDAHNATWVEEEVPVDRMYLDWKAALHMQDSLLEWLQEELLDAGIVFNLKAAAFNREAALKKFFSNHAHMHKEAKND